MNTENILIPFSRHSADLKSLYHAFALAERIKAKLFVLFFKDEVSGENYKTPLEKACLEMVHSACEEGMSVSFHIVHNSFEQELLNRIENEHIDVIVIGAGDMAMEKAIKTVKSSVSVQIIKVTGKK